jgi:hypothetical protein
MTPTNCHSMSVKEPSVRTLNDRPSVKELYKSTVSKEGVHAGTSNNQQSVSLGPRRLEQETLLLAGVHYESGRTIHIY